MFGGYSEMSLTDSYRRSARRKNEDIIKLQKDKASKQKKIADFSRKIQSARGSIQKTKSSSTIKTKHREIERHQKDYSKVEKELADIETKIAKKQKEYADELSKLHREEGKESVKREKEAQNSINSINKVLTEHKGLHTKTQDILKKVQILPEKITVLFLASNPIDQKHLRLDEEARAISETIKKTKHRDSVNFISVWATRPMDVLQALNEYKPAIVHFSGHGSSNDEIVFQDDNGNAKLVSLEAIVQTMMASSEGIRLVFFNTCHSHNQANTIVEYVEAAIGMNTTIGDEAAIVFASQFYSSIGFGLSLKKAFEQAKALLMLENIPEENTPQLFTVESIDPDSVFIVKSAET